MSSSPGAGWWRKAASPRPAAAKRWYRRRIIGRAAEPGSRASPAARQEDPGNRDSQGGARTLRKNSCPDEDRGRGDRGGPLRTWWSAYRSRSTGRRYRTTSSWPRSRRSSPSLSGGLQGLCPAEDADCHLLWCVPQFASIVRDARGGASSASDVASLRRAALLPAYAGSSLSQERGLPFC
jgi:hypothetical protein